MGTALLGISLNPGITTSLAIAALAVLWRYSALPEIRWELITGGVMYFLAGAGVNLLNQGNALKAFFAVEYIEFLAAFFYTAGSLMILFGSVLNAYEISSEEARILAGEEEEEDEGWL